MARKIRLGVNLDHVATLRAVRGRTTPYPDLLTHVQEAVSGGAEQITIHLREDRRHIHDEDLALLSKKCPVPLNLEMGATDEMVAIALKYRPAICCLVPEKREELTTEGGLDVAAHEPRFAATILRLSQKKIPTSLFIEPGLTQVEAAARVGARAVEFHTGHWVTLKGAEKKIEWRRLVEASQRARDLGLHVHAGHGLDFHSAAQITRLPELEEVNIGHFIVCTALRWGLRKTVSQMKKVLKTGQVPQ